MIAQRGRSGDRRPVGLVLVQLGGARFRVVLTQRVQHLGVEVLEPHAYRTIPVLEPGGNEAVLHLGHLDAGRDHEAVCRAGGENGVPGAAQALADGPRTEDVGGAAGGDDDHRGAEDVELVVAHREARCAGDLVRVVVILEQVGDGHTLVYVLGAEGGAGWLRGDGLDRFPMDGNLPTPYALVLAVLLLPDGEAPFLKQMDRIVHMPAHVVYQVLASQSHHVVDDVVDEILGGIPAVALTHIAVNGGQTFTGGATALYGGLFGQHHSLVAACPVPGFEGGSAAGHAAAYDQYVAIHGFGGLKSHGFHLAGSGCRHRCGAW